MFNKTHIGQQVSDPFLGNGVIIAFNSGFNFPVTVKYDTGNKTYDLDGRLLGEYLPTLQFGPLDNYVRRVVPTLQDGQYVQVPIDQDTWVVKMVRILNDAPHYVNTTKTDGTESRMPLTTWRCAL